MCVKPDVAREEYAGASRLDLIIRWQESTPTHIEVKVGDLALEKTFDSAVMLEKCEGVGPLQHFILLPSVDLDRWTRVAARYGSGTWPTIGAIEWRDVAIALRRCLRAAEESLSWRVWARSYLGAIEQRLLAHPRWQTYRTESDAPETLDVIDVLKEALVWRS